MLEKTFLTDKPLLRYSLFMFGVVISAFTGATAAILLFGVLFKH